MNNEHLLNLQPGTVVNGRYEVVKCLGTGSMGMVYACRHRELAGHIVAMKVLFAEVARDEVAAARFRNEIVASYGVSHPNVVRAYEYFRDGDLIAFTMEYIGGGDLADRISDDEPLEIGEIVSMVRQMASGVQAIHEAGIIHRDLKPENILLTPQGQVKITDFGIARCGTGPKLTEHGGVVGTIDYVSPEYLERGLVDQRSDIYALGVMVYEMITGEAPYKGKSIIETMTMRLRSDPEPPHHLRHDCPIALSNVVMKALKREPEERYQSAQEIIEDLRLLAGVVPRRGTGVEGSRGVLEPQKMHFADRVGAMVAGESIYAPSDAGQSSRHSASGLAEHQGYLPSNHGSRVAEVQVGNSGTLELDASTVSRLRESPVDELDEAYPLLGETFTAEKPDHLASVHRPSPSPKHHGEPTPSISVSNSSLSTERIKELSQEMYAPALGLGRTLLGWALVLLVGFLVGLGLKHFLEPRFFADGGVEQANF